MPWNTIFDDMSQSSVAGEQSHVAATEPCIVGGESHMTGDWCWPEMSIHRCVCMYSQLDSYIYSLVVLLATIQLRFSKYHYLNRL
jgi:hypothetical protein